MHNGIEIIATEEVEIEGIRKDLMRIKATCDFPTGIKKGTVGGLVQSLNNLTEWGWIEYGCMAIESSIVSGTAILSGDCVVRGAALIEGNSRICGSVTLYDQVIVRDGCSLTGIGSIRDRVLIEGASSLTGSFWLSGDVRINGATLYGSMRFQDQCVVEEKANLIGFIRGGEQVIFGAGCSIYGLSGLYGQQRINSTVLTINRLYGYGLNLSVADDFVAINGEAFTDEGLLTELNSRIDESRTAEVLRLIKIIRELLLLEEVI